MNWNRLEPEPLEPEPARTATATELPPKKQKRKHGKLILLLSTQSRMENIGKLPPKTELENCPQKRS